MRRGASPRLRLLETPRRHAALLLNIRGLERVEHPRAEPRGPFKQHAFVDDEAIGAVREAHTPAAVRSDERFDADVRSQPREEQTAAGEHAPHLTHHPAEMS